MTCDGLNTVTTVEFSPSYQKDEIIINDEELKKDEKDVLGHLERIRKLAGIKDFAKVVSETNFPVAAGLASSASGLAAITVAASKAAGLRLSERELTMLTRQGSGSACRSILGGFAEWRRGQKDDGSDSFAETVAPKTHWPQFRMIATVLSEKKKPVGSRAGMKQTVETCPFYKGWLDSVEKDLDTVRKGILEKNFTMVGQTAEHNFFKLHAIMMATVPAILYCIPESVEVLRLVRGLRESGTECYATMDAGPQVKILCLEKDEKKILAEFQKLPCVKKTIVCRPGDGAKLLDRHLF